MRLNIHELKKKREVRFVFDEDARYFSLDKETDFSIKGKIHGDLLYKKEQGAIIGTGKISFIASIECQSCLQRFDKAIETNFIRVYEPIEKQQDLDDEHELSDGELDTEYYEGEEFCINQNLRDEILLAIPDFPRCKADCKGVDHPAAKEEEKEKPLADWQIKLKEKFKQEEQNHGSSKEKNL